MGEKLLQIMPDALSHLQKSSLSFSSENQPFWVFFKQNQPFAIKKYLIKVDLTKLPCLCDLLPLIQSSSKNKKADSPTLKLSSPIYYFFVSVAKMREIAMSANGMH